MYIYIYVYIISSMIISDLLKSIFEFRLRPLDSQVVSSTRNMASEIASAVDDLEHLARNW